MAVLPRVALGTISPGADLQPILWALLESLRQQGLQCQTFLSRACFSSAQGEAAAAGVVPRHLDTWLMTPEVCRETFTRGALGADLAVIEGQYDGARRCPMGPGGSLDRLCEWLDLPRVVMLDATDCDRGLPRRPSLCDAVLIDYATDAQHLANLTAAVRAHWGVPVLGGLEALPSLRTAIRSVSVGSRPAIPIIEALADAFQTTADLDALLSLSMRRPLAWVPQRFDGDAALLPPITVALAYDRAFDGYFPDALDALEARGATLVDFSPCRDERLPEEADVVYFGCGHPEAFAEELAANQCMKLALRDYVRQGGRVYAEGGGLAYLCEELETPDGALVRMSGVFPARARRRRPPLPQTPVEVAVSEPTWLAPAGIRIRGYANPSWYLEPSGPLAVCAARGNQRLCLVRNYQAIGSNIHINFAAASPMLSAFFEMRLPATCVTDPWPVARGQAPLPG